MHSNVPLDLPCGEMFAMKDNTQGVFYIMRFMCCVFFVSELEIAKSTVWKVNFELNKLSNSQANTNTNK
jgi:hypothetical protein